MPFANSIVAGTALIRPAINSPNYVPGSAGWSINKDGSAEFNDATIRGDLESANYVPGSTGWHLDDTGSAEFYNIIARGELATGSAPGAFVRMFDTESGYAQVVLSTNDPNQVDPAYVFATQVVGAGNALYLRSPDVGFGDARIKLLGSQDGVSPPQVEFAEGDTALELLVKTYGNQHTTGYILVDGHIDVPVMYATFAIMGDPNAANVAINGNQVYARNAAVNNGNLYLNHASSGNVYLGQTGIITVEPGGVLNSSTTYLHLNWTNSKPCAIGSSPTVQSRLGGGGGWRIDDTLQVVGYSTFAYPVAGTANTSLTAGGLLQRISSSRRYKTDIAELEIDPEKILELIPRQFRFKHHFEAVPNEWDDNSETVVVELPPEEAPLTTGFIAEEADELGLNLWTEYNEDGEPEGFNYSNFIAAHQLVLRSQAKRIAELEERLARLEGLINA